MINSGKLLEQHILVTGGAGYIGSHACKALANNGFLPITYDNLSTGHKEAVQWGPLEVGDITDKEQLNKIIKKYQPATVMHFAAHALVGESVTNPEKYYQNNVIGTLQLLKAMIENNIEDIIFSSSCSVYGIPNVNPIPENHVLDPINPYGRSKMICEYLLKDFSSAYDIKYISLRYFNAAGADADGCIGEKHINETHLIPLILDTALGKRPNISIYGNDYNTPDGTCIRDYIHVMDLANAHIKSLLHLRESGQSRVLNLGTGKGYSVQEIINTAQQITKKEINKIIVARRPGDPDSLIAKLESVEELINWTATDSSIENIIKTAWRWHKNL